MATRPTSAERLAELELKNRLTRERIVSRVLRQKARAVKLLESAGGAGRLGGGGGGGGGGGRIVNTYSAATRTRLRPGGRSSMGSAPMHLSPYVRDALTRDCQDLERNSTAARVIIRRAQQFIVGDGPIVRSTSKNPKAAAAYDRDFAAWSDALDPNLYGHPDIRGQQSLPEMLAATVSAWCTSGDELWVLTKGGQIQIVEAPRLVNPPEAGGAYGPSKPRPGGGFIADGIETDAAGKPIRYHVADWNAYGQLGTAGTTVLDARYAWLAVNPIGVRAGFRRGEPALQAVLPTIERLDSYIEKVAVAAEIATLFAAIVTDDDPAGMQALFEQGTDAQPERSNTAAPREVEINAGTIQFLGRKGEVHQLRPEFPTTNFKDFVTFQLSLASAELGIPLVAVLYDSQSLSWSNIKAVLSLSMRSIEPAQARLARMVRWVRAWRIRRGIAQGLLPDSDDYAECTVEFPRAPVVDFGSEVKGYREAIDARLMTRDQAIQALGTGTFTSVKDACAAEEKDLAEAGIPAINTPGAKGGQTPPAPPAPEPPEAPEDANEDANEPPTPATPAPTAPDPEDA